MRFILIIALLLPTTAMAQQQKVSPSQLAINIDSAVNGLAQALERANATIADLQNQVQALKNKYEPQDKKATTPK